MDNNKNQISIKAKLVDQNENRRFSLQNASFAELAAAVSSMFAGRGALKLAYVDADGDTITFSTQAEFVAALDGKTALTVLVSPAEPPKIVSPAAEPAKIVEPHPPASPAPPAASDEAAWLRVPVWRRHKIMAKFGLQGDVNDASLMLKLPLGFQAFLAGHHLRAAPAQPLAQPGSAGAPTPEDEAMWAACPLFFKERVVAKFVPHLKDKAAEFATFQALPFHVKFRVRARAAQLAKLPAPQPRDAAADQQLWASLPSWVQLKIASKAAKAGVAIADPHSFAVFEALPDWKKAKIAKKAAKKQHKGPWRRAAPAPTAD